MDEEKDLFNSAQPEVTDWTKPRKESSVERQALKKTAVLAGLGIALSCLLYCLLALFNLGKNDYQPTPPGPPEKRTSAVDTPRTTESTGAPRKGRLTAITYSEDKPSAVVDFKILHEGDVLHGVEVVKIEKDRVHFKKNRKSWEQTVGQTPPTHWK
ncbi:MAG: hypothetical protein ACYS8Z_20680 [Planctomycetota bacterium]|jgi:hypothetical protein